MSRLPQFESIQATPDQKNSTRIYSTAAERHIGEQLLHRRRQDHLPIRRRTGAPVVYGGTTRKQTERSRETPGRPRGPADVPAASCNHRTKAGRGEPQDARRELNLAYDRFVGAYGPINKTTFSENSDGTAIRRMPNLVKFREDPDALLVMSLEDYDEVTGKGTKAAIMARDVVGKTPPITHVRSAEEGLLVSLNQKGAVDLPFIGTLYGKQKAEIVAELGDLIYPDPETRTWQTADAYLSGNVRAKLAAVESAGPQYVRNVNALRSVQPEDVLPGDIDANLGAPWIPESDIQAFAADLFHVDSSSVPVAHLKKMPSGASTPDTPRKRLSERHRSLARHGPTAPGSWSWP